MAGRGFYDRNTGSGVDSVLADMQDKRERERAAERAYLLQMMGGKPYEQQVALLQANPRASRGLALPELQKTPQQLRLDAEAQKALEIINSWKPSAGETSVAAYDTVVGRTPNKEFTERAMNRGDLGPEAYRESVEVSSGLRMNAKDAAEIPSIVRKNEAQAYESTTSGDFNKGGRSAQAYAAANASNADARYTGGAKTKESEAHAELYGAQAAGERKEAAAAGVSPAADYGNQRQQRIKAGVDDLISRVSPMTAGPIGQVLKRVGGTPAKDFAADLSNIEANVAFSELQEMRAASKTGGALGQVAVKELELLKNSLTALDQDQSPANLKKNLEKLSQQMVEALERWDAAKRGGGEASGQTVSRADLARMAKAEGKTVEQVAAEAAREGFRVVP